MEELPEPIYSPLEEKEEVKKEEVKKEKYISYDNDFTKSFFIFMN
jgi:hypothetical protein